MKIKMCSHISKVMESELKQASKQVCEECVSMGSRWVHLRVCQICGKVLCCESSPNKHILQHFQEVGHSVLSSAEPGERWVYCYKDDLAIGY